MSPEKVCSQSLTQMCNTAAYNWIYFNFIVHAFPFQLCQTTAGIKATSMNVDSVFRVFLQEQRYCIHQIIMSKNPMCYIQQIYMLGHIQHWKFTTNTYNEFSGTGSVQWRNDMVLLCPSWSCCWPGNYFHLSAKLILCHWPSHSFVTAFHVNPLHSFINPHGKLL